MTNYNLQGANAQSSYQNLRTIGEHYVAFLQKVGQSDAPVTSEEVSQLFAPQCKKIVNGIVLFDSSSALPDQLNTARNATGKWRIKTLLTTTSPDDGTCTIQIEWTGERIGKHTTMMVLFLDDRGKITQMHEVYNEYKESHISEAYNEYKKPPQ
jgi:hypothetical protein